MCFRPISNEVKMPRVFGVELIEFPQSVLLIQYLILQNI